MLKLVCLVRLAEHPSLEGQKQVFVWERLAEHSSLGRLKLVCRVRLAEHPSPGRAKNRCLSGKGWLNIPPLGVVWERLAEHPSQGGPKTGVCLGKAG